MLRTSDSSSGLISHLGTRVLSVAALGLTVLGIVSSASSFDQPLSGLAITLATAATVVGWVAQTIAGRTWAIWLLGAAALVLRLFINGPSSTIVVVVAIAGSGSRLSTRVGAATALAIGLGYLLADTIAEHGAITLSTGFTAMGLAFTFMLTLSVRRIRQERERAEALLIELQQSRDAQVQAAALGERARIAREIHDVLAHTLSALAVQLEGTRMVLTERPGDPAAVTALERAHRLAREGLEETRRAVSALRGDNLPGPEALTRLTADFSAETGVPCSMQVVGQPRELESDAQLAVYRTAQEALTNVRKHATHAAHVEVVLRYADSGTELTVDNSNGTLTSGDGTGYGLIGMRERAELLGGTLHAGPHDSGFRVRLWLPKK